MSLRIQRSEVRILSGTPCFPLIFSHLAFPVFQPESQIAYVHIRSMNQPSLGRFQNEISRFANKKGIVVDIRYNGGGNIDQEILDILERRPYEFWNNRWVRANGDGGRAGPSPGRKSRSSTGGRPPTARSRRWAYSIFGLRRMLGFVKISFSSVLVDENSLTMAPLSPA